MPESKESKFWSFNVGHVITLLVYLITATFFFSKLDTKTEQNTLQGIELKQDVKKIETRLQILEGDKSGMVQTFKQNDSTFQVIDIRVTRLEDSVQKIAVIAKDIDWIKSFLMKNNSFPDSDRK